MKTFSAKPHEVKREWFVVDATDKVLGRLATEIARRLRGKHKPTFTYNQDCGDFVIVINADRVVLTGRKENELIHWHTGWPGGLRNVSRGKLLADDPVQLVEKVIWGMTPKTKLGKQIFSKLKVYAGEDHPHAAQKPELIKLTK